MFNTIYIFCIFNCVLLLTRVESDIKSEIFFLLHLNFTDSAFTERILGFPSENYKGYVEADATQRARHIPSYSFFLMHGLADKSAPYLHGTQMARALTEAGVIFQYQVSIVEEVPVFFIQF